MAMTSSMRLTLTAQTLYAELLEQTMALEASRSAANLSGTFTNRVVKGRTYHYYVYRDVSGKFQQVYLGADSDQMRAFVERVRRTALRGVAGIETGRSAACMESDGGARQRLDAAIQ